MSEQAAGGEEAAMDRLEEEGETVEEEEEGGPRLEPEQSSGANSKLGVVRGKKTYPVSFLPLDPGWGKKSGSGSGSGMKNPDHISESLETSKESKLV